MVSHSSWPAAEQAATSFLLWQSLELRRHGHEPFFIGTQRGMEAKLVPAAGFPIEWIEIGVESRRTGPTD